MTYKQICVDALNEINRMRADPPLVAREMEETIQYYFGSMKCYPGRNIVMTREGLSAVLECIEVLKKTVPLPLISWHNALSVAA